MAAHKTTMCRAVRSSPTQQTMPGFLPPRRPRPGAKEAVSPLADSSSSYRALPLHSLPCKPCPAAGTCRCVRVQRRSQKLIIDLSPTSAQVNLAEDVTKIEIHFLFPETLRSWWGEGRPYGLRLPPLCPAPAVILGRWRRVAEQNATYGHGGLWG